MSLVSERIIHTIKSFKSPSIISLGSSLNLKLILSLEENQYKSLGIDFSEIKKTEDLQKIYPQAQTSISSASNINLQFQKLTSLIELHSNNFLFNSLLFLNHSSSRKLPIKYFIPFSPKFPKELNFIYNIIKSITETNCIYIEDANLLDIKPKIIFNLKLIKNDVIIEEKSFIVCNENHFDSKNKDNSEENKYNDMNNNNNIYNGDLFSGLNLNFNCDFFYSSLKELYFCKKDDTKEIINFMEKIEKKFPKMKICINFEEDFILNMNENNNQDFIKNLVNYIDIYIFEKKNIINYYDKIFTKEDNDINNNNNNMSEDKIIEEFYLYKIQNSKKNVMKIYPQIKLGIFIDELKQIALIEQSPKSDLVINNISKMINIIPPTTKVEDIKDYNEIIRTKYASIKSVYVGSFLNHLFKHEKNDLYNICFKSALKCTMRYLEILKFGIDVPSVQKYYEIKNPKIHKKKINKEELKNKQLENKFVLDCTNLNNKFASYNSILDENCRNFFNSKITLKHLYKQGFINKKGLLIDPERRNEIIGIIQPKFGINKLIKKIKTFHELNSNNINIGYKPDSFNERNKKTYLNSHSHYNMTNQKVLLPKIKNGFSKSLALTKNTETKKKEIAEYKKIANINISKK